MASRKTYALTGRQKYKLAKKSLAIEREKVRANQSKTRTRMEGAVGIAGSAGASTTASIAASERQETERAKAQSQAYQAALSKWNGVISSTPEAAEGTANGSLGQNSGGAENTGIYNPIPGYNP